MVVQIGFSDSAESNCIPSKLHSTNVTGKECKKKFEKRKNSLSFENTFESLRKTKEKKKKKGSTRQLV